MVSQINLPGKLAQQLIFQTKNIHSLESWNDFPRVPQHIEASGLQSTTYSYLCDSMETLCRKTPAINSTFTSQTPVPHQRATAHYLMTPQLLRLSHPVSPGAGISTFSPSIKTIRIIILENNWNHQKQTNAHHIYLEGTLNASLSHTHTHTKVALTSCPSLSAHLSINHAHTLSQKFFYWSLLGLQSCLP